MNLNYRVLKRTHYANESQNEALRASVPASRIQFCFPPMNGPGNMHSKLQILKFATYLRIAVPTGNFVPYDWGETGVMENVSQEVDKESSAFVHALTRGYFDSRWCSSSTCRRLRMPRSRPPISWLLLGKIWRISWLPRALMMSWSGVWPSMTFRKLRDTALFILCKCLRLVACRYMLHSTYGAG